MKHTQNPWELVELPPGARDWTNGAFVVRSERHAPGGIAVTIGGLGSEEKSNARLIAAAPELLEALREIVDSPRSVSMPDAMHRRARKAIAKAEGNE